jgi:hypothetical protein
MAGDGNDARICCLLYQTRVKNKFPSQDRLFLKNGKQCSLSTPWIDGRRVCFFPWSEEIERRFRRQVAERSVLSHCKNLSAEQTRALAVVAVSQAGGDASVCATAPEAALVRYLGDLSLPQVEQLAAQLVLHFVTGVA